PCIPSNIQRSPEPSPLSLHDALPIFTEKLPKPTSRTSWPRLSSAPIVSSIVSTARDASLRASPVASATAAISSCLFKASPPHERDRKSTRLNSSHVAISYAVFCLKKQ